MNGFNQNTAPRHRVDGAAYVTGPVRSRRRDRGFAAWLKRTLRAWRAVFRGPGRQIPEAVLHGRNR
ncbi:MAG: hypothetical protein EA405_10740 [Rhodospirillales bacterium]|nr:MAG: hypothetical protein EA405_10740 [Rhodospirillales bacterium]